MNEELKEYLKEYVDLRWYDHADEQRFVFEEYAAFENFVAQLHDFKAEFLTYRGKNDYKVDVFLNWQAAQYRRNWYLQEVNALAERLVGAGDMASFQAAFDSTNPDFDVNSLSLRELQNVYEDFIEFRV